MKDSAGKHEYNNKESENCQKIKEPKKSFKNLSRDQRQKILQQSKDLKYLTTTKELRWELTLLVEAYLYKVITREELQEKVMEYANRYQYLFFKNPETKEVRTSIIIYLGARRMSIIEQILNNPIPPEK